MQFRNRQRRDGIFLFCVLSWALVWTTAVHAGGPENVVLVVNADSASSKLIANHYIALRDIPSTNIVYLNGLPNQEVTTLEVFREQILKPVLTTIQTRGLAQHIDYIVYSSDFPTSVNVGLHLAKLTEIFEQQNAKLQRKLYLPNASITSLTYFAGSVLKDDPGYMTLEANTYYRRPAALLLLRPFVGKAQEVYQAAVDGLSSDEEADLKKSEQVLLALSKANPRQLAVTYRLVQCYAQMDDSAKATDWLGRAIRTGWQYRQYSREDKLLDNVRTNPVWQGVFARIPDESFEFAPTIGFRSRYQFGFNGMLNALPGQGNRYILSTALAVTRNYGTTEEQALAQIRRTTAADGTQPLGTFFFTDTPDVRSRTRKPNFDAAVKRLNALGHDARVVKSRLPSNNKVVLGASVGTPSFSWPKSGSRFVPGAIADNLTSYGGRMNSQPQTKLTEFLAYGAAGASGTVTEPFALQAKFPHPMIHVHYARGCTLAEAFYQSVHGPMQLLIVGDALCRPFGEVPGFGVTGVVPDNEVSGTIELKLLPDATGVPIAGYQLFVDGKLVHVQATSGAMAVDTAGMADGHHDFRIVAIADNTIESSSTAVIPIQVNNHDHRVSLNSDVQQFLITDEIELQATSNLGDQIALVHNGRTIAMESGREVTFKFDASLIGRGPVQLEAIATATTIGQTTDQTMQSVASRPLMLEIQGPISNQKKYENPPKVKTPAVSRPG